MIDQGHEVGNAVREFFSSPPNECGNISNERALQLELAYFFRLRGWGVRFEVPMLAPRLDGSTLRAKTNLDLLVEAAGQRVAIELKVPLNGQHPETIYSFCADLEFVEAIKRAGMADLGYCVMATPDAAFWRDSGRGSSIHNLFRSTGSALSGTINKPTGAKDSCVVLQQEYTAFDSWHDVDNRLLRRGRYLLLEV